MYNIQLGYKCEALGTMKTGSSCLVCRFHAATGLNINLVLLVIL